MVMDKNVPVNASDMVSFLDVLLKYCVFYFGEEEGELLYTYYCENHADVIAAIKKGKRGYGEKLFKLRQIFKKIEADVFFNKTQVFHIKWPYHTGESKLVDFELFQLTRFNFYEALGEARTNKEERLKLAFDRRIVDLLLPPQKDCLFNHAERYNNNMARIEQLYVELKKRNPDILKEYGKNFWELTKNQFSSYIFHRVKRTPQHLVNFLWYRIKEN
jgi:hypothetical protein